MEGGEKQMIRLFGFDQAAIDEKQLTQTICDTLRPYFGDQVPEVRIKGRPHKYEAYFEVDTDIGTAVSTQPPNSESSKQ
jgi:hypothetical protein